MHAISFRGDRHGAGALFGVLSQGVSLWIGKLHGHQTSRMNTNDYDSPKSRRPDDLHLQLGM